MARILPFLGAFIFILVFEIEVVSNHPNSTSSKKPHPTTNNFQIVDHFVHNLIQNRFSNCTSILIQDGSKYTNNFNHISSTLSISRYLVNLLWNNETENSSKGKNLQFSHENRFSASRKFGSHCMVAVLYINVINAQVLVQIRNLITPNFLPIMRKDEDHFIFVTKQTNHKKLLLMEELPNRTKFKIAVGIDESKVKNKNDSIVVSTIDFFGGPNGSPRLVQHTFDRNTETFKRVDYFPDFFWDFNGSLLRITLPVTKSMVESDSRRTLNNFKKGRWSYLVEEFLRTKFNFTYFMFLSTDINGTIGSGGTGLQLKNGTWVGMTGDLLYGRADIGLAIANTEKRNQNIGFTDTNFDFGCLTFVTGQPVKMFSSQAMFWPFDATVWLSLLICCFFGIILTALLKIFLFKYKLVDESINKLKNKPEIRSLLAPFVEQDFIESNASSPLRCFIGFWSFFAIIITNLYRSKLVTLLAFPIVGILPETFSELAESDFNIAFMKHGDSALNTFKASEDPVYQNLLKRMEIVEGVGLECLEKVVNYGKSACIAYDFDVIYLTERNFTDGESRKLAIAPRGRTYNVWLGIGTEAYSIYKPNFGKMLGYTMPFHLAQVWNKMDIYKNVRLPKLEWRKETNQIGKMGGNKAHSENMNNSDGESDDASSDELTLRHIHGIVYFLFGSAVVGIIVFVNELIYFQIRKLSSVP